MNKLLTVMILILVLTITIVIVVVVPSKKQCSITTLNPEYVDSCCVKIEGHQGEEINSTLIFVSDLFPEEEVKIEVSPDNRIPYLANVMCPLDFNSSELSGMTFGKQTINFTKCQSIPTTKQVMRDCERRLGGGLR